MATEWFDDAAEGQRASSPGYPWRAKADCRGRTDLFTEGPGYNEEKAKRVCRECGVISYCYDDLKRIPRHMAERTDFVQAGLSSREIVLRLGYRR